MTSSLPGPPPDPSGAEELRRWRDLFDRLPAMVAFWDRDLRNTMANRTTLDFFGLTAEEIHGQHVRDVLGEDVFRENLPYITAVLTGEEQRFDRPLVRPDGQTSWFQTAYLPEIVDGEVTGFFVMGTDVTTEAQAHRDLLEAQSLAGMGSYTYRPPGVVAFSPQLLEIMGRDPSGPSPTLEEYLEMVHPDDLVRVRQARAKADQGMEYEIGYRIIRADGQVRHVHSRTRQVLDAAGHVVLLRGVMQDETRTQRVAADLESANTLLSDLIGILGHDLRQPMAVVRGYLEQAEEDWDVAPEEERRHYVRTAARTAARMDGLLEDILTMVNLDTGTLQPRTTRIPLAPLLGEHAAAADLGVQLRVDDDLQVYADPVHLQQMLSNLLGNAARYGLAPFVLEAVREGTHAAISLRDHGEGVPPEFAPRLFDRFSRASTGVAATVGGTGFGLYIVRQLALANDGDVGYAAGDPVGSVFTVRLPCTLPV